MSEHRARAGGHVLLPTDAPTGRRSYLCTRCGAGMSWSHAGWSGTLASPNTRCFPEEGR